MIFLILFTQLAVAESDQWFCTTESGQRSGNVISACGVGQARTETMAREYALVEAMREFNSICKESDDCVGRQRSIEPKRLTCTETKSSSLNWKCYRLIEVTLGSIDKTKHHRKTYTDNPVYNAETERSWNNYFKGRDRDVETQRFIDDNNRRLMYDQITDATYLMMLQNSQR